MNDVWAIFSDKTATKVNMNLVVNDKLYFSPVAIDNSEVIKSAEKAITASIEYFESIGLNFPEKKCGIIFAFEGNDSVTGSSASLSFALKLVYKIKEYIEDVQIPFSIAATGIVDGINKEAHIIKVDYMNQKIEAALKTLNPGDIIFFPIDNVSEILKKNIERCHQSGIKLQAVSTISDAVHKLL